MLCELKSNSDAGCLLMNVNDLASTSIERSDSLATLGSP